VKASIKVLLQTLSATLCLGASVCNAAWINSLSPTSIRLSGPTGDITFAPANLVIVSGCSSNDFYVIKSVNNSKLALAILMMAKASTKTVSIYIDDPQALCDPTTGRPMFTNIVLGD
jgi:hypothetical protein